MQTGVYCWSVFSLNHYMQTPLIYAYSWLALLAIIIMDRRITWVHHHLSWLRTILHRLHFFTIFVEHEFLAHSFLQMPFVLLICGSNLSVLLLYPRPNMLETVNSRIGEIILINLIVLLLISSRHSLFNELAAMSQKEVIWAHKILGTILILEVFAYTTLSVKRTSSKSSFAMSPLTTQQI